MTTVTFFQGSHQCLYHFLILFIRRYIVILAFHYVCSPAPEVPDNESVVEGNCANERSFLLYLWSDTVVSIQFFFQIGGHWGDFSDYSSCTIGKLLIKLRILVTSAGYHRIQFIQIHLLKTSEHIFRHARIVMTRSGSTTTAFNSSKSFAAYRYAVSLFISISASRVHPG